MSDFGPDNANSDDFNDDTTDNTSGERREEDPAQNPEVAEQTTAQPGERSWDDSMARAVAEHNLRDYRLRYGMSALEDPDNFSPLEDEDARRAEWEEARRTLVDDLGYMEDPTADEVADAIRNMSYGETLGGWQREWFAEKFVRESDDESRWSPEPELSEADFEYTAPPEELTEEERTRRVAAAEDRLADFLEEVEQRGDRLRDAMDDLASTHDLVPRDEDGRPVVDPGRLAEWEEMRRTLIDDLREVGDPVADGMADRVSDLSYGEILEPLDREWFHDNFVDVDEGYEDFDQGEYEDFILDEGSMDEPAEDAPASERIDWMYQDQPADDAPAKPPAAPPADDAPAEPAADDAPAESPSDGPADDGPEDEGPAAAPASEPDPTTGPDSSSPGEAAVPEPSQDGPASSVGDEEPGEIVQPGEQEGPGDDAVESDSLLDALFVPEVPVRINRFEVTVHLPEEPSDAPAQEPVGEPAEEPARPVSDDAPTQELEVIVDLFGGTVEQSPGAMKMLPEDEEFGDTFEVAPIDDGPRTPEPGDFPSLGDERW